MWDLIVSVPDHCLSFYFLPGAFIFIFHTCLKSSILIIKLTLFFVH